MVKLGILVEGVHDVIFPFNVSLKNALRGTL